MVLVLAAALRISKGKAFAIVLPWVVLMLVFIMIGAAFTPSSSQS
jgi:hypothetical protein